MNIQVVHISRRPQWPLWAVSVVLVWLALGGTAVWLGTHLGRPVQLCLFKRLTHLPCPTCGFTRGVLCLLHGQLSQCWLCNPLLFSILGLFFAAAVVRLLFAQGVRIHLTHTERTIAWVLVIAVLFTNWAYVIFSVV